MWVTYSLPTVGVRFVEFIHKTSSTVDPTAFPDYLVALDDIEIDIILPTCYAGNLTLIPSFQGTSNEATDMRSIAESDGLILHDGPTINARRLTTLEWGQSIIADAYIEFPQSNMPSQLWYRVTQFSEGSTTYSYNETTLTWESNPPASSELLTQLNQGQDVWITARHPDMGSTTTFTYIEGVNEIDNPCSNLLDARANNLNLTFIYDREATARYAMAHAYRNSVSDSIPYPGNPSRVTSNLESNNPLIPVANGAIPNSFAMDLPYSYFIYPQQVQFVGQSYVDGKTGSAMFTSQAYWMGGFPMTFDLPNNDESCVGTSETSTTGWRYCSDTEIAKYGWRAHEALVAYYSNPLNPIISQDENVLLTGYIPSEDDNYGYVNEGLPALSDISNRQNFYQEYFAPNSTSERRFTNIRSVELGDYIYINRQNADLGHGFIIVGWGEITSCEDALGRIWTYETASNPNEGQLFFDFASANNDLVIPYVVDFSGGISYSQLQRPRPRPFYCAQYRNPDRFRLEDSYAFYGFPSTAITLSVNQIYQSTNWSWEN